MMQVNMLDAKTNFSKLIRILEQKEEDEIIIARDNKPIAKLILFDMENNRRIGVAKGKHKALDIDLFNQLDKEIAEEFYGE